MLITYCNLHLIMFSYHLFRSWSWKHYHWCVLPLFFFTCRRAALEAATSQRDPHLPSVEDFKWRVDVAISTR